MSDHEVHVVFGANGPLGKAIVKELSRQDNIQIKAVSRTGGGDHSQSVLTAPANALSQSEVIKVCEGASVIYHCMNTPYSTWNGTLVPMMKNLITAAAEHGSKLVYGDNLYSYAPQNDGVYNEGLSWEPVTRKGRIRAEILKMLKNAADDKQIRFTVGMASDFYGPNVTVSGHLGERVFANVLAGKAAQYIGKPELPHTFTYLIDMAQDLITLALDDRADNEFWHVRNAPALSFNDIMELLSKEINRPAKLQAVPGFALTIMGLFNKDIREIKEMLYQFYNPFIIEDYKFKKTFGGDATPLAVGLHKTVEWYKKRFTG